MGLQKQKCITCLQIFKIPLAAKLINFMFGSGLLAVGL